MVMATMVDSKAVGVMDCKVVVVVTMVVMAMVVVVVVAVMADAVPAVTEKIKDVVGQTATLNPNSGTICLGKNDKPF